MRQRSAAKRSPSTPAASTNKRGSTANARPRVERTAHRASDAALDARLRALRDAVAAVERAVATLEAMPAEEVEALPAALRDGRARAIADGLVMVQSLRNDELRVLNDAFEDELPALRRATRSLARALDRHEGRAALIDAVASAIGIVANLLAISR